MSKLKPAKKGKGPSVGAGAKNKKIKKKFKNKKGKKVETPIKTVVAPPPKSPAAFSSNWKVLSKDIVPEHPIRPRKRKAEKMEESEEKSKKPPHIPKEYLNKFGFLDYNHYGKLKHCTEEDVPENFKKVTRCVAIDCEMVGVDVLKTDALARVSVVNHSGYCLLDTFVKPKLKVTDYRTAYSGVREEDLKDAPSLDEVMKKVSVLLKGRILVGHALQNDLDVLYIQHPKYKIRDTARYFRGQGGRTPSLKSLAEKHLKVEIQSGEHSSIQDAQAAMKLYLMHAKQWEKSLQEKKRR
jgi:RNA exonuclease 4